MPAPPSDLFTPISLDAAFNCERAALDERLKLREDELYGAQCFRGIPFAFGAADQANALLLDGNEVSIATGALHASYLVFAHIVEDRRRQLPAELAQIDAIQPWERAMSANELGDLVAEYALHYEDGSSTAIPVRRRFAIQQARVYWGASAFAAVPHTQDEIVRSASENIELGRIPIGTYGRGETRHGSGRDAAAEHIWLYALPNPEPDKAISEIRLAAKGERALVYGISATQVEAHPLRAWTRRKLALTLPDGVKFNAIGELDGADIDLRLGQGDNTPGDHTAIVKRFKFRLILGDGAARRRAQRRRDGFDQRVYPALQRKLRRRLMDDFRSWHKALQSWFKTKYVRA